MSKLQIVNYIVLGFASYGASISTIFWLGTFDELNESRLEIYLSRFGIILLAILIFSGIISSVNYFIVKFYPNLESSQFYKNIWWTYVTVLGSINVLGTLIFALG